MTAPKSTTPVRDALRAELAKILAREDKAPKGPPASRAVIHSLGKLGTFYRHADQEDFGGCLYFHRGRLYGIRSDAFRAWLAAWTGLFPGGGIWPQVLTGLEYHALNHSIPVRTEAYFAVRQGKVYISNGPGSVVIVSAGNVENAPNGTEGVLFLPGQTCAPWKLLDAADALDPFTECALFRGASVAGDCPHGRLLAQLWLYCLPACTERPPLALIGDGGAGKTPFAEGLQRLLIGGESSILTIDRSLAKGDVMVTVEGGGIALLDNADSSIAWFCDWLASVTTGGEQHKRQLYTDKGKVRLRSRGGIVLTSATPIFAGDSNVSDRLAIVKLERRSQTTAKAQLFAEIAERRDACLSHLTHTLAAALSDHKPVTPGLNQRYPDFAGLAVRVGRALGREQDAVDALRDGELEKSRLALASNPIAQLIANHVERGGLTGTADEIARELRLTDVKLLRDDQLTARVGRCLSSHWTHFARLFAAEKTKDRTNLLHYCLLPKQDDASCCKARDTVPGVPGRMKSPRPAG